jgi:RNA polymerase sigma factor (sigma-70 family)
LLHKHGPLVWGVCRRVLREAADAEDAFQATFLVFAQKAATIRKRTSLACWLYGVTNRIARRLRDKNQRMIQGDFEPIAGGPDAESEAARRELCAAIDDTLAALPERLRLPLILCYLNGKSQDEAAAELGLSKSTLRGRLERGRAQMQQRLARRGITLTAALLSSALTDQAFGSVSTSLVAQLGKAAVGIAAGKSLAGLTSAEVLALTTGEVKAMLLKKCVHAFVMACLAVLALTGAGVIYGFAFPRNNEDGKEPVGGEQDKDELALGDKLDVFVRGAVGKYSRTEPPKEVRRQEHDRGFLLENVAGKEIPKGTKVHVLIYPDTEQYLLTAKGRQKIEDTGGGPGFRSLFVIERDQIAKIKKEGENWWIEPKAIVLLKRGEIQDWVKTLHVKAAKIIDNEDELRKLIKQRQHAAIRELEGVVGLIRGGSNRASFMALLEAGKRYADSTLELTEDRNERLAVCRRYLEFTQNVEWELDVTVFVAGGGRSVPFEAERAVQARIDAEILLLKETRRKK